VADNVTVDARKHLIEAALAGAIARELGAGARIDGLKALTGGTSCEIWSFDLHHDGNVEPLILRCDTAGRSASEAFEGFSFGPSMDRDTEGRVQAAAEAAGVPVAAVRFHLRPEDGVGAGYVMARLEGEAIARRILRDETFAKARQVMASECGTILAGIHAIKAADLPPLPSLPPPQLLDQFEGFLDRLGEPHPVFELALRWLRRNLPPERKLTPVHGDFRNGNLMVGPAGVVAVLDWELTHFGDPLEDVAWICIKAWRFGAHDKPVGGFGQRADMLAAYEAAGGGHVTEAQVHYWEVFATLRWGIICLYQAWRHLSGVHPSIELAAIGRRAAETELDLVELLG
jgi:aminoglycoside phosphotransferase (APT) family kinase protein